MNFLLFDIVYLRLIDIFIKLFLQSLVAKNIYFIF